MKELLPISSILVELIFSSRCLSSSLTQKEKKNGEKISVFDLESGTDFN